jgi:hypothetical protein
MENYSFDDIKKLLERIDGDEKFIEMQTQENSKLQARLNRIKNELRKISKTGGAFGEWANKLLEEIRPF